MKFPTRTLRSAMDAADHERSIGIPDRQPIYDTREVVPLDMRTHGGKHWQIEPRLGYVACRVRDVDTGQVECVGTMKRCLRWVSGELARRLGSRNLR